MKPYEINSHMDTYIGGYQFRQGLGIQILKTVVPKVERI
jgi:hypothetical protein